MKSNDKLSDNFTKKEFMCKCGCNSLIHINFKLLIGLEKLRTLINKPIHINSGYRCKNHHSEIKKSKTGQHTLGNAADIKLPEGMSMKQFHDAVLTIEEFKGIGIPTNSNYIHVDCRTNPAKWGYSINQKEISYDKALDILGWK